MKKVSILLMIIFLLFFPVSVKAEENDQVPQLNLSAESAILLEASTGKVICEKEADSQKPPASVTKIMTLLLIFEDFGPK